MSKIFWITATPRVVATGATTTVRLAGGGTHASYYRSTNHWRAGVVARPKFKAELGFNEDGWTGGTVPATGNLAFQPSELTLLNELGAYLWKDAALTVEVGEEPVYDPLTDSWSAGGPYSVTLTGTVSDAAMVDDALIFEVGDLSISINKPLVSPRFAGSGGAEGGAEAAGRLKRRSWGRCFNIEGRVLDKATNVYEFGDPAFPWQQWDALRDMGRDAGPVTFTTIAWQGSVAATLTALKAAVCTEGSGAVAPSIACAKWWTQPQGPLTADIRGEVGTGYVETAPEIAARIVAAAGGPAIANTAAMAAIRGGAAGIHIDSETETTAQALDRLLLGVSLLWVLEPAGTIRIREWTFSAPVETLYSRQVTRRRSFAPIKTRRVRYQRSHRIHSDGEISAAVLVGDVVGLSLAAVDAAAAAQLAAATASLAAAANDGKILAREKIDRGGTIDSDRAVRSRLHSLFFRAAALGILATSQNLLLRSEEFDNAAWTKANAGTGSAAPVVTANAAIAPDGTMTADRIVFDRGTGNTSASYSIVSQTTAGGLQAGRASSSRIFVKSATSQAQTVMVYLEAGADRVIRNVTVGADWLEIDINDFWPAANGNGTLVFGSYGSRGGDNKLDLHVWAADIDGASAYPRPYVKTGAAAVTQAAVGTLADDVFAAYVAYRDAHEFAFPAWDDAAQDSTLYPADNQLASPADFSTASWTRTSTTATPPSGTNVAWWTLADTSAVVHGVVEQALPAMAAGQAITAMFRVKKDAIGKATRYPAFAMPVPGATVVMLLDTSTGELVNGSSAAGSTMSAIDCGMFWLIVIEYTFATAHTPAYRIHPSFGAGAAMNSAGNASATNSIQVMRPVFFLGSLATIDRQSFRNRTAALEQKIAALAKAVSEVDSTTSLQVDGNASIDVPATSTGDASSFLPVYESYSAKVGTGSVTAAAVFSRTVLTGTITCAMASNQLQITALGSLTATVRIDCLYNGVTQSKTVTVNRQDAQATVGGGGGGGSGSASQTISAFGSINSTSFTTIASFTITAASAAPTLTAQNIECIAALGGGLGSWNVEMKWVRSPSTDVGSIANSNPDPAIVLDSEGMSPTRSNGAITCNTADSGRTVGAAVTYLLQAKLTSGTRSISFAGSATVSS